MATIPRFRRFVLVALSLIAALAALALPAAAVSVRLEGGWDGLVGKAPTLVLATCIAVRTEAGRNAAPATLATFVAEEAWGDIRAGAVFEVMTPGGVAGDSVLLIPGALPFDARRTDLLIPGMPAFEAGRTYFMPLGRVRDGRFGPFLGAAGVLERSGENGEVLRTVPEAGEVSGADELAAPAAYRTRDFLDGVAARREHRVSFRPQSIDTQVVTAAPEVAPANCEFLIFTNGFGVRYTTFESGGSVTILPTTPGQSGLGDGGSGAVVGSAAAWTNHLGSKITLLSGAAIARNITCTGSFDLQQGVFVFDDPCSDIADMTGCSGILGVGGLFSSGQHSFDGTTWNTGAIPYGVINNGAQCIGAVDFSEMMAHEVGHGLGFGHHTADDATMRSFCCHPGRGAALGPTDEICAAYLYPETVVPPAAPSNLTATALPLCGAVIGLAWNDNSTDETAFEIERSSIGASGPFQALATRPANATSHNDTTAAQSTTYWYRVLATNSGGDSGYSNVPSATSGAVFYGDLNQDGVVNSGDSVILANFLVGNLVQGSPPFNAPLSAADLNTSSTVNSVDAVILANHLVGNIACLPQ